MTRRARLIRSVRDLRAGLIGAVAVMFAATACLVALGVTAAAVALALRGGEITAEQINVISLVIGVVGTFTGLTGALLANPNRHGRATDPGEESNAMETRP